jgi:hypothetical protein
VSPPSFLPETPLVSPLGSQKVGRRHRNPERRPSQGDRVLINRLAPKHQDIAQIAGESPLSPEPDTEDEEDGEATHHNAVLASTEPREQERFTLINPAKVLDSSLLKICSCHWRSIPDVITSRIEKWTNSASSNKTATQA